MIARTWVPVVTPASAAAPSVALAPAEASLHARASASGTGRVPGTLAHARELAWSFEGLPPVIDILAHGDRIVLVRDAGTSLEQRVDVLDRHGELQQTIFGRRGPWLVDPRGPMLLGSSRNGDPTAWSLADPGASPILWSTRFGRRELRDLRLIEERLVVTALRPRTIGGPPPSVLVATIAIESWDDVSPFGILRSATGVAERIADDTAHAALGIDPAGPILATDDHVAWMDWSLEPRGELELPGHPLLVSPRADGRAWMLALHDGEPELRLVAPGSCALTLPVHASFTDAERLLVAPDDAVIIIAPSRIQCFDSSGTFRWKFARDGAARGLVDASGTTLFTHGPSLVAADASGRYDTVWTAPPRTTRIGPLALSDDLLLTAAGSEAFALRS